MRQKSLLPIQRAVPLWGGTALCSKTSELEGERGTAFRDLAQRGLRLVSKLVVSEIELCMQKRELSRGCSRDEW